MEFLRHFDPGFKAVRPRSGAIRVLSAVTIVLGLCGLAPKATPIQPPRTGPMPRALVPVPERRAGGLGIPSPSLEDRFVIVAPADIDPAMIVRAHDDIDPAMVFHPRTGHRESGPSRVPNPIPAPDDLSPRR